MSHHAPTSSEAVDARKQEVEGHTGSHGHSVAAWTGVIVCLVGSLIASFAVVFALVWLFWVGILVMALSGVLTIVLSRMGHGQGGGSDHHSGKPSGAVH